MNQLSNDGHCYEVFSELVKKSVEILDIEEPKIVMTLGHLINSKELFREYEDKIYPPPFYFAEAGTARKIKALLSLSKKNNNINNDIDSAIEKIQAKNKITYDKVQREAIKLAVRSKFCLITGGPGTGKTTTTKAIIEVLKSFLGKTILLAAPTGRTAKRMSELTGMEAKTIHRMLDSKPPEAFGRDEENPLEGDVLLVDEASMVDIMLMYNLLKAVPPDMTVILIGDVNQLPSVGAGNVLGDIIDSKAAPVVKLTSIFRQAMGSQIITNSHKINTGRMPDLSGGRNSDFFFIELGDNEAIINSIVSLCVDRLPKYYNVDPINGIQILSPMRRGATGADNLNHILQEAVK